MEFSREISTIRIWHLTNNVNGSDKLAFEKNQNSFQTFTFFSRSLSLSGKNNNKSLKS